MRKIAISDIHGCNQSFLALLDQVALTTSDELYLLGDYIDRGINSKGLIDNILNMRQNGYAVHCLMGKHEQMLLDALADVKAEDMNLWLVNGGVETMESYRINGKFNIPASHYDFYNSLELYYEVDEYILVHAGLNFKMPQPLSDEVSMLWIRDWYHNINRIWLGDRVIVHGHTPTPKEDIEKQFKNLHNLPVLDIDGGCVHKGRRRGVGYLCAFDLTSRKLYFQEKVEN